VFKAQDRVSTKHIPWNSKEASLVRTSTQMVSVRVLGQRQRSSDSTGKPYRLLSGSERYKKDLSGRI
jgi:hypothetical protein